MAPAPPIFFCGAITKQAIRIAALAIALLAPAAHADDEAASTNLFNAGRDLMKAGDYAAACPKLAESVRLKATVGALAKLAACEEHEHRLASAYGRWQQAANLARSTGDARASDVQDELTRIEHVVPKLLVTAEGEPADLVVHVDDLEFRAAGLGVPIPVEPGHHSIRAVSPKKKEWSATVDTSADGSTTAVKIPALEDAPSLEGPLLPPPVVAPVAPARIPPVALARMGEGVSSMRVAGILTTSVGAAVLAAGGVLGVVAIKGRDDANCQGTACPDASSQASLNSVKGIADASTVLFVAGGVIAAAGVTIWVLSPAHAKQVQVGVSWGGAFVKGTW